MQITMFLLAAVVRIAFSGSKRNLAKSNYHVQRKIFGENVSFDERFSSETWFQKRARDLLCILFEALYFSLAVVLLE